MRASTIGLVTFIGLTNAKSIKIDAGSKGLAFNPNTVTADVGDTLEFRFYPANHSVAQGDFSKACQPISSGGFASGFFPVSSGESSQKFVVTVTDTKPMFFYCPAPGHCKGGMVGVVNPSGDQNLDAYKKAASAATTNVIPTGVYGGQVVTDDDGSESAATTKTSGTALTTMSSNRTTTAITSGATSGVTGGGSGGTSATSGSRSTNVASASTSPSPSSTTSRSSAPTHAVYEVLAGGHPVLWVAAGIVLMRDFVFV